MLKLLFFVTAAVTLAPVIVIGAVTSWFFGGFIFGWEFAKEHANSKWER